MYCGASGIFRNASACDACLRRRKLFPEVSVTPYNQADIARYFGFFFYLQKKLRVYLLDIAFDNFASSSPCVSSLAYAPLVASGAQFQPAMLSYERIPRLEWA